MKRIHSVTTLAVAGAMSVGAVAAGTTAAGAATSLRTAAATPSKAHHTASKVEQSSARTIRDDVFSVTRLVSSKAGARRVIFSATDLRTGRTVRLN
jgi:hypothetical protein